jgi:HAE1 family hydrophobic/amphiphilic exporter-1
MLCARLPAKKREPDRPDETPTAESFGWMTRAYAAALDFCLRARFLMLLVFLGSVAATGYLFAVSPKGFLPQEDIGQLSVQTQAREDISSPT